MVAANPRCGRRRHRHRPGGDRLQRPQRRPVPRPPEPLRHRGLGERPGFNSHHDGRSGTYVEDCGGAGGNVCFAVNTALDPAPDRTDDVLSLYDLVTHEFGHCLTIGHVGDGAEGAWGAVPTNDIMAYNADPPGLNKCVSTLDVEGIAVTMSKYLDVNGDGDVTSADKVDANDPTARRPMATGRRRSRSSTRTTTSTRRAPGRRRTARSPTWVSFPGPAPTGRPSRSRRRRAAHRHQPQRRRGVDRRRLRRHRHGREGLAARAARSDRANRLLRRRRRRRLHPAHRDPSLDVEATPSTSTPPSPSPSCGPAPTPPARPATASSSTAGPSTPSFATRQSTPTPSPGTPKDGTGAYMADGTSTWDTEAKTVSFHIPHHDAEPPASSSTRPTSWPAPPTSARWPPRCPTTVPRPERHRPRGRAGVAGVAVLQAPVGAHANTVTFEHPGGNTFLPEDSTLGSDPTRRQRHRPRVHPRGAADQHVELTLAWTDASGGSDLDLSVTGGDGQGGGTQ